MGGLRRSFLPDTTDTDGSASALRAEMKPDSIVPPPHSRGTFDETVFCAAGAVTFTVNGKPVPLTAGDARFIQRGAIHGFRPGPERGATSCASPREVAA